MNVDFMKEAMDRSHYEKCPCWSLEGHKECAITEGGVYIPLLKHRMLFCDSPNYIHCPQYLKGKKLALGKDVGERRRVRRYEKNVYIDILVSDSKISPSLKSRYKARVLDMSLYGMKIELPEKIAIDDVVDFQPDIDACSDFVPGVGMVKWCGRQVNSDKYELGMAFTDDTLAQKRIHELLYQ